MVKDAYYTMRLPKELLTKLKQTAEVNDRSVAAEVRLAIKAWLKAAA